MIKIGVKYPKMPYWSSLKGKLKDSYNRLIEVKVKKWYYNWKMISENVDLSEVFIIICQLFLKIK